MPGKRLTFRYTDLVKFMGEPGLGAAIIEGARINRLSTSEYLRQVIRDRLTADGVALPPITAPALAGA